MDTRICRFKDFRFFGGSLTVVWKPCFAAWWSTDGAPPDRFNRGFWLFGKKHRAAIP